MQSQILLHGLTVHCIVGLLPEERLQTQDLVLNLSLELDYRRSARVDALLDDTVDYALLSQNLVQLIQERKFETLECLVWSCIDLLMNSYAQIQAIDLEAIKPTALSFCPKAGLRLSINREEWLQVES